MTQLRVGPRIETEAAPAPRLEAVVMPPPAAAGGAGRGGLPAPRWGGAALGLAGAAVLAVGLGGVWCADFVQDQFARGPVAGWLTLGVAVAGGGLLGAGLWRELRALAALATVDRLRRELASGELRRMRRAALQWVARLEASEGGGPGPAASGPAAADPAGSVLAGAGQGASVLAASGPDASARDLSGRDLPGGDVAGHEVLGRDVPRRDLPGRAASGRDLPGRDAPSHGLPGRDMSGRDALGRETPGRDVPGRDVPGRDVHDRDVPGRDVPDRDAPDRDVHDRDAPGRAAQAPGGSGLAPALRAVDTPEALLALLRAGPQQRLRGRADALARIAALQMAGAVAVTPAPALDVAVMAWRGVRLVRQVAELHGMRPGLLGTLALLRRTALAAAAVAATELAVNAATHALLTHPLLDHVLGDMAGAGVAARRMFLLGRAASAACCPLPPR